MLAPAYQIPSLPPPADFESVRILKALNRAGPAIAYLKGQAEKIPNRGILVDTLALQEAKASSEIENLAPTQDELFQADAFPNERMSPETKEVALYRDALHLGYTRLKKTGGLVPNSTLIEIYRLLKRSDGGFRATPGTALKNERTGETVYVPPQNAREITEHMSALERFVNDDDLCHLDPLIKMALIHHQFESIHPFSDGNGRIGRILNVLYLVRTGKLDIPVLYLSRYITRNKEAYYRYLQGARDQGGWEDWVEFMLDAVAETSATTSELVDGISDQMSRFKCRMRKELPKIYSQDLLNNLFRHPYTRIEFVQKDLRVSRQTAARHLDALVKHDFLEKRRAGKTYYFINVELVRLFLDASGES